MSLELFCVLGCYGCSSPKTEMKSPDGHIKMALTVDDNGKPLYNILVDDSLLIENNEGHPVFQFFRDFDPDCDESKALAGEPGEFVAIVRKAKGNYFLGAATNEKPRTLEIKLDFLEPGKQYKAVIYADGENADWKSNPTDYRITEQTVTSENTLNIRMAAGGGQAISFIALKKD